MPPHPGRSRPASGAVRRHGHVRPVPRGEDPPLKVFLSFAFPDERFVRLVLSQLRRQPRLEIYFWPENRRPGAWEAQIIPEIERCDLFVAFLGQPGDTQIEEIQSAQRKRRPLLVFRLPNCAVEHYERVSMLCALGGHAPIVPENDDAGSAQVCAQEIVRGGRRRWIPDPGLPIGYPFDYEKDIILEYVKGGGRLAGDRLDAGCPESWPDVERRADATDEWGNPLGQGAIGSYRPPDARILVDARRKIYEGLGTEITSPSSLDLTFPEAGPRARVQYPRRGQATLRVGILVSGGIAPGINAVIDGIAKRHLAYKQAHNSDRDRAGRQYSVELLGLADGFAGLERRATPTSIQPEAVEGFLARGGSCLTTSRADSFLSPDPLVRDEVLRRSVQYLQGLNLNILYVIGGEGSMRGAHAIQTYARRENIAMSVVAIPKTMDNDILWVWQSFGFLSAVERATEFVRHLEVEARSNPRLCVVQLFGSDSGFVVGHTALASGTCDLALIPEVPFDTRSVCSYVTDVLSRRRESGPAFGVVVMAETAIPVDVEAHLADAYVGLSDEERRAIVTFIANARRVRGQTPDALRRGGLKIVSRLLERSVRAQQDQDAYWEKFRVFVNEPRHLVRAIGPSVNDVIFGQRLGALAVDNAMAGYEDFMVSQWLTEYVLVPLRLVALGRKRVPRDGVFWKSVISRTGQPELLVTAAAAARRGAGGARVARAPQRVTRRAKGSRRGSR